MFPCQNYPCLYYLRIKLLWQDSLLKETWEGLLRRSHFSLLTKWSYIPQVLHGLHKLSLSSN